MGAAIVSGEWEESGRREVSVKGNLRAQKDERRRR